MDQRVARTVSQPKKLCLYGCAPDTGNLGVSALFLSMLSAISGRYPDADITVFDNGKGGGRPGSAPVGGRTVTFTRCGANMSRRYHRSDNLMTMKVSAALGGLGNLPVRAIRNADAVLDISGGDSFTDLYGMKRFKSMTIAKQLAIALGTPLIFMPQTYGPFTTPNAGAVARRLVAASAMAWARDEPNHETLRTLLGTGYVPERHRRGVDIAFALPRERPHVMPSWLNDDFDRQNEVPVVGFNVSGLIYNRGADGSRQFGFKADYQDLVHGALERLLSQSNAKILLIPHVLERPGSQEADTPACRKVAERLARSDRVRVLDEVYSATEMKWVIAQTRYFCGTRMHSTIAGLSSHVPTTAIAYSKKTQGVFESCGQGENVVDPRHQSTGDCIDAIWRGWQSREATAHALADAIPGIVSQAHRQNDEILDFIDDMAAARRVGALG